MKIEVLRNLGPGLPDYGEGQVVEVDDDEGKRLVGKGLAIIKGVPKAPEITAPQLDEPDKPDTEKRYESKRKRRK